MKDKIIDGISALVGFLFNVVGWIIAIAIVLAYHFGIPYLFYKFLNGGGTPYTFYLAVWFGTSYVLEMWEKRKIKRKLDQYKEIDDIMKGRF
ncbi:hypothetical protein PDJ86_22510 [Bacillus cereus group sp. TH36-2LC]|uniref:hypothetical protein n=1 Tax=Bacillus cereus group sp. TH36-2LC TaxID=3018040 RepID=UPI0022E1C326|nr:hypothetical protein [Bacillus cereus group sp. TH36-2LC]MDA1509633.1 hypothetical protein [Bacillus cereus group sp. TH36-2LC]